MSSHAVRRSLRLATVDAVISYRALFWWWSPRTFFAVFVVTPLSELLFFVYVGRTVGAANDAFYVVGNTVSLTASACLFGGMMAIANERQMNTLSGLVASPAPRLPLFLGRALPFAVNGCVVSLITFTGGVVIVGYHPSPSILPGLAAAVVVGALSCSALGLVVGAIGLVARDAFVLPNILWFGLSLTSGANIAPSKMPPGISTLGAFLPLRHAVAAARHIAAGGGLAGALPDLALEAGVGTAFAVLAMVMLALFERAARRGASLERR